LFSLVIPFHSDVEKLGGTLTLLRKDATAHGIREILLCHNGSVLDPETRRSLEARAWPGVQLLSTPTQGIGAGYKLGIAAAREEFVVLSASDLPFGFTDVDAFRAYAREHGGPPAVAIGSKAHPHSRLSASYGVRRRLASRAFWLLRALVLGRETPKDSQGSILVRTELARALLPELAFDNYLCSLELVTLAQRRGHAVVELPIEISHHEGGASSVSLLRDGTRMAIDLVQLSRRLREGEP
jgi:hypothetical protein